MDVNKSSIVELRNVIRSYSTGSVRTIALNGVDFALDDGEFTALVGPSGSGKTTLLQLVGCLDRPDSGQIMIKGEDVALVRAGQRAALRREMIGFIFQFFALIPVLSAYENVELPLLMNGMSGGERRRRVLDLLAAVGLSDRTHHRPDELSGGEQQRVAIARALAPEPLLVLADEPTANLDSTSAKMVMEIMERLNQTTGTAFLFATHDPLVVSFARRVVYMRDGVIVADEPQENEGKKQARSPIQSVSVPSIAYR